MKIRRSIVMMTLLAGAGCAQVAPDEPTAGKRGPATLAASAAASSRLEMTSPSVPARPQTTASTSATARAREPARCPTDMVEVQGAFCRNLEVKCLERRKPWQCAKYEQPSRCRGDARPMHYCIDRYEHPNRAGALADIMKSWRDAKASCEALDKRLCTDAEWTLACEGPERLPFPYGYTRDAQACPIDKRSPLVNERRLLSRTGQRAELERLDQREPSGARQRCVSAYGVHDLTGNVDEWVVNESGRPYRSALKGGNWGEYRNACRPATRGHDEGFRYYQTGFRCCRDADGGEMVDR